MPSNRFASWNFLLVAMLLTAMACFAGSAGAKPSVVQPGASAGPAPVEGTDYFLIDSPEPIKGAKVEVVEVFGYGCPICNAFQPRLVDWEKALPADVHFSYLPAAFGADPTHCWDDFARAFYVAQAKGVQVRSHDSIYKEVFEQHRLVNGCASVPSLYTDYGIDAKTLAAAMQADAINTQIVRAHEQAVHWGVDGTPTIIVDGKYRVVLTRDGGPSALLHAVDWLIAQQRPLHAKQPTARTKKH